MSRTNEGSELLPKSIQDDGVDRNGTQPLWKKLLLGCGAVAVGTLLVHASVTQNNGKQILTMDAGEAAVSIPASVASPYSKFQPLGFAVYTGGAPGFIIEQDKHGKNISVVNPECDGLDSYGLFIGKVECYMGLDDNVMDVKQRLAIMTDAVERAYELSDKDSETLKIFITPEFFWRGADGAYVYDMSDSDYDIDDDCREICQILSGLEELVAQKRFEHWFFHFGTVIASEILPEEDQYDNLFYNFAPLYKGYDPSRTDFKGKRFIVPKRYVSNMDFLTPQRHFNETLAKELLQYRQFQAPSDGRTVLNPHDINKKKYDRVMWHQYKGELDALGYEMIEYDWLILDGITFSVEVCLDHDMHTALNTYMADAATGSNTRIPSINTLTGEGLTYVPIPRHQAQISLVSSSGMTVNIDSLALTSGGTIILQDGMYDDEADIEWSDECSIHKMGFGGGNEAIQRLGFMSETEVIFEYKVITDYEKLPLYGKHNGKDWKEQFKGVFTTEEYPPSLRIYQTSMIAQV